jgi:hypothetical protein
VSEREKVTEENCVMRNFMNLLYCKQVYEMGGCMWHVLGWTEIYPEVLIQKPETYT